MRRGRTVSRKLAKTKQHKPARPKRGNASTTGRRGVSQLGHLQEQVISLARELADARDQQTATSEVLQVISSSPGDLKPVFKAILDNAVRICEAKFGNLFLYEAGAFRIASAKNAPTAFA